MPENPPFQATIGPTLKDIITESDPTAFVRLSPNGEGERVVWDNKVQGGRPILFYTAAYDDTTNVGENVEVRVEKETFHLEAGGMP